MRRADQLLLCSAVIYTMERIAASFSHVSNWYAMHPWKENVFLYVFLVLALIEYARLIWPRVKEWYTKRRNQYDPDVQNGQSTN